MTRVVLVLGWLWVVRGGLACIRRARLELEADRINYRLRLDSHLLREQDRRVNNATRDIYPGGPMRAIIDSQYGSHYNPYDFVYGEVCRAQHWLVPLTG